MIDHWLMGGLVLLIVSFLLLHSTKSLKWIPYLLLGIFASAFPILGILHHWKSLNTNAAAKEWPTVPGIVTKSGIHRRNPDEDRYEYSPVVNYEYTIDGVTRQGLSMDALGAAGSYPNAHETVTNYPIGSHVDVFWNPEDPEDVVLEFGSRVSAAVWIELAGFTYFLLAVIVVTKWMITAARQP